MHRLFLPPLRHAERELYRLSWAEIMSGVCFGWAGLQALAPGT
jgi:hypothetical protein